MYTLKLLLDTTKADEVFISSVFDAIAKVHNILVAEGKKRLRMLKRDKRYKYAREHYGEAAAAAAKLDKKLQSLQKKLDDEKNVDKAAVRKLKQQIKEIRSEWRQAEAVRKQYAAELNERLEFYGASKNGMESFATQFLNPKFKGILGSQQIQVEADRVWFGMEKVLFGDGRDIHYKKYRDIRTVRGKQNTTGIRFIKDILSVLWNGHTIPVACKKRLDKAAVDGTKNKDIAYKLESLSGDIRYCEIVREEFMDGYHYYAKSDLSIVGNVYQTVSDLRVWKKSGKDMDFSWTDHPYHDQEKVFGVGGDSTGCEVLPVYKEMFKEHKEKEDKYGLVSF